jgi:hypothetical protein
MPKKKLEGWERGLGPYSKGDPGLTEYKDDSTASKDISDIVDKNSDVAKYTSRKPKGDK